MVASVGKWSLFGGGRLYRFDYTFNLFFKIIVTGLSVCFADVLHIDTHENKRDSSDINLYAHCICKKSTIMRSPGV